jgi:hypothetical protein
LYLEREAIHANKTMLNEEKSAAKAKLDAQVEANRASLANLEKEVALRKAAAVDEFQMSKATREMREARRKGDTKGYAKAEKENEEAAARQKERDLREKAKSLFADEPARNDYVKSRMDEFRQQQAQDKKEREEREKNQRDDTERGQQAQGLQYQAAVLRKQGKDKEAKALDEQAAQIMDESKRRDLAKEYRGMGMSDDEAQKRADAQIKFDQANRELDRAENTKGKVVASSMAAIGGGGGVYGLDPSIAKMDKANELAKEANEILKAIAINTGTPIDNRNREE